MATSALLRRSAARIAAAALAVALASPLAAAQRGGGFGDRMAGGLGGVRAGLDRTDVEAMSEILLLDVEQEEIVRELYAGYRAELGELGTLARERFRELREELRGGGGFDREAMQEMRSELEGKSTAIREGFYDDVRLVLTEAQSERWGEFEKRQARATALQRGGAAGTPLLDDVYRGLDRWESVTGDLGAADDGARSVLSGYGAEIDRLVKRQEELGERPGRDGGDPREAMRAWFEQRRELAEDLRSTTMRYASQIEQTLPEAARPAFRFELHRGMIRRGFGAGDRIARALQRDDLSDAQREELEQLATDLFRASEPLAEDFLAARRAAEAERGERLRQQERGGAENDGDRGRRGRRGGDRQQPEAIRAAAEALAELDQEYAARADAIVAGGI